MRYWVGTVVLLVAALLSGCASNPEHLGLAYAGRVSAGRVQLLVDETWVDEQGWRHVDQEIFDAVFGMIDAAEEFIQLDMFLLNDFGYVPGPGMRPLSQELTDKLVEKRKTDPDVEIVFISDPVNSVYKSVEPAQFKALEAAGVEVVWTDLNALRDSNPAYSFIWRIFIRPFGIGPGNTVANPLGEGRISLRSKLKLLNFKANHRKLIITEQALLVTSANPHSASSAHWNTALRVDGAGMGLGVEAENAVLNFSGADEVGFDRRAGPGAKSHHEGRLGDPSQTQIELLTEIRIRDKVLKLLDNAQSGDRIELCMFYLCEKKVVKAFIRAQERGCDLRIILDPSKDAFGRIKDGIPNRQSAARLVEAGIPLRWADTHGEQCHVKMLYVEHSDGTATLLLGSANFTRRNLNNFNCEADLAFIAPVDHAAMARARETFERWWHNSDGRFYTAEYSIYEDPSRWRRFKAWWQETTGMGTF